MILRMLLNVMNPYKRGRAQKNINHLHQVRVVVYCWIIRCLSVCYTRYAYEDIIDIGHIKVYQSRRDEQFEQWLAQIKIDVRPHLKPTNMIPAMKKFRWWRPFYKFFHMETITSIFHDKDEIILHRSPELWMTTTLNGCLELSDDKDILQRSRFKALLSLCDKPNNINKSINRPSSWAGDIMRKDSGNGKVSLGETRFPSSHNNEIMTDLSTSSVRKVQGAEVDESF